MAARVEVEKVPREALAAKRRRQRRKPAAIALTEKAILAANDAQNETKWRGYYRAKYLARVCIVHSFSSCWSLDRKSTGRNIPGLNIYPGFLGNSHILKLNRLFQSIYEIIFSYKL